MATNVTLLTSGYALPNNPTASQAGGSITYYANVWSDLQTLLAAVQDGTFASLDVSGNALIGGDLSVSGMINADAGAVGALGVNVGTNGNGFYEASSVQLGVAVGNTQIANFNAEGLATDGLLERVVGVGIPFKLGSSGAMALRAGEGSVTCAGGATEIIAGIVPAGACIIAVQTRNDTLVVLGGGGVNYKVTINTQDVATGVLLTKNTKTNSFFDVYSKTPITSVSTDLYLTPDAGTMTSGTITAIVYYYELDAMASL